MSEMYDENDSGQDLPDEKERVDYLLEIVAIGLLGMVAFLIVYAWAK